MPLTPETRIYLGDVMTLVGATHDVERAAAKVGQVLRYGDRTDIAFLAAGIAAGLLIGLLSMKIGSFAITLGGAGGTLLVGLICGWLRSRRPTVGSYPPAAEQTLSDIGLGGFIAAIGLANGPRRLRPFSPTALLLLSLGVVVTLVPLTIATFVAHRILHLNPVIICGALAGAMTVDAAVTGMLRTRGQSDAGTRGRRALCGRKRSPDHPRPRDRDTYLRRVTLPAPLIQINGPGRGGERLAATTAGLRKTLDAYHAPISPARSRHLRGRRSDIGCRGLR